MILFGLLLAGYGSAVAHASVEFSDDSVVALYPFDSDFSDATGNGHGGTSHGGVASLITTIWSKPGSGSLLIPGAGSGPNYLDLANTTRSPFDWNSPVSVSFWVQPLEDISGGKFFTFKGNGMTAIKGITYALNNAAGHIKVYADSPGNHFIVGRAYTFASSTWYYIVMTKDSSNAYSLEWLRGRRGINLDGGNSGDVAVFLMPSKR